MTQESRKHYLSMPLLNIAGAEFLILFPGEGRTMYNMLRSKAEKAKQIQKKFPPHPVLSLRGKESRQRRTERTETIGSRHSSELRE